MTFLYRLSRSRLNPSLLLTLLTTPILKKRSSPPAVRPPMYHLSAPRASRKPSLLLSLPRRRAPEGLGIGMPLAAVVVPRGEWMETPVGGERLLACDETVVAFVDMARGVDVD